MQLKTNHQQMDHRPGRGRTRLIMLLLAAVFLAVALLVLWTPSPRVLGQGEWWDLAWRYRFSITVDAADYGRTDKIAEQVVNFSDLLDSQGDVTPFEPKSIRVLEVDSNGNVIDAAVPFQFDRAIDYSAANNAVGTLVWLMTGQTAADAQRTYHVYFDVKDSGFEFPDVTRLLTLQENITDPYGFLSYVIEAQNATYWYHQQGGGFASLFDQNDNDWISWNTAAGAAGNFRGIPNLVHPNNGGYFHPGRTTADSSIQNRGTLKITIRSSSLDQTWKAIWEIFPTYARMTVQLAPVAYYFNYEGTPGGLLEPASDFIVRSTGEQTLASTNWTADITGEEWMFAADPTVGRSLYLIHYNDADTAIDSYKNDSNKMTILAFGRNNSQRLLTQVPLQLAFGLVNATTLEGVGPVVQDIYKPLSFTTGAAEKRPFDPSPTPTSTASPSPTPTATDTPSPMPTASPTSTPTATLSASPTPTETPTATPTDTPTLTPTPTVTLSASATATPSPTPTATATASPSTTASPTAATSATPTQPPLDYTVYLSFIHK